MYKWVSVLILGFFTSTLAVFSPRLPLEKTNTANQNEFAPVLLSPAKSDTPLAPLRTDGAISTDVGHLNITLELDKKAVMKGVWSDRFLQINVTAPDVPLQNTHHGVNIGVVMDTSGSMSSQGKIDYAKYAAKWLIENLEPTDTFSLVTFSTKARTLIHSQPVSQLTSAHQVINSIQEGGGTHLYDGIQKGTEEVIKGDVGENIDRMILLSDGKANIGPTDSNSFQTLVASSVAKGVAISTIGLGREFNEQLLLSLSDIGGGSYDYVDNPKSLSDAFQKELNRAVSVVASQATLTLDFPRGVEPVRILGWPYDSDGQRLHLNLGEMYSGETKQIILHIRLKPDQLPIQTIVDARLEYHDKILKKPAYTSQTAVAEVTADERQVNQSIQNDVSVKANTALSNWYLKRATAAYRDGNLAKQRVWAVQGMTQLKRAASELNSDVLRSQRAEFHDQMRMLESTSPQSELGKHLLKSNDQKATEAMRSK